MHEKPKNTQAMQAKKPNSSDLAESFSSQCLLSIPLPKAAQTSKLRISSSKRSPPLFIKDANQFNKLHSSALNRVKSNRHSSKRCI